MYKSSFVKNVRTFALVVLVALLSACGSGRAIKNGTTPASDVPASYDLTVAADKDGQFDFDGATLTPEDMRGHIRFLSEAGRPVHAILLKPGEKEKIKNTHIAALASICRDLKITAYVQDNDGQFKVIKIVE
ncbi:MAG: hypothetical protein ABJB01_09905 [Rudaea sp.]